MEDSFSIVNKTKVKIPALPLEAIKNDILGKNYCLSFALVDKKTSRKINKNYRNKDKATNILSFVISKKEGEIVMCPSVIKDEIRDQKKSFNKNFTEFFCFLFIHGLLHLKGLQHGPAMEKAEKKYLSRLEAGRDQLEYPTF